MAHWCESCGQQLPEGELPGDATWLTEPSEQNVKLSQRHLHGTGEGRTPPGREKKLLLAVGALVAAWGLFVGISSVVTPDDSIDDQVAAEIEQARIDDAVRQAEQDRLAAEEEREQEERERIEQTLEESLFVDEDFVEADADRGITAETQVASPARDTGQIERLQRELERRGASVALAYQSTEGIVIVNMSEGEAYVADLSTGVPAIEAGVVTLRSWAATYAIDPGSLSVARVVEDTSLVVTQTHDGNSYFVSAGSLRDSSPVVEVVEDGSVNDYPTPGGYRLVPFDGLGLVAVPREATGNTLLARSDGFAELSENQVLAATGAAVLEQECANPLACQLQVTRIDAIEDAPVPVDFGQLGDSYALAPDGLSLLRFTNDGFAEVFEVDTKDLVWVGGGMNAAAWGPNSDFIAWLDLNGDPRLKLMFLDKRDWVTIELTDLGVPPPIAPELVVFTHTNPAASAG